MVYFNRKKGVFELGDKIDCVISAFLRNTDG